MVLKEESVTGNWHVYWVYFIFRSPSSDISYDLYVNQATWEKIRVKMTVLCVNVLCGKEPKTLKK